MGKQMVKLLSRTNKRFKARLAYEFVATVDPRIDEKNFVIKHVKVIGNRSKNRRLYPPAVLRKYRGVYEGARVFADHMEEEKVKAGKTRPLNEWAGVLRGVYESKGELFAESLVLNRDTEAGRMVMSLAKTAPDKFGLSPLHLISGYVNESGVEVIEEIKECWSVDVVSRPATTQTLWESVKMDEISQGLQQTEQVAAAAPVAPSIEEAFMGLHNAIMACDDWDDQEKLAALKDAMKLKAKMLGNGEEETPEEESHRRVPPSTQLTAPQKPKKVMDRLLDEIREMKYRNMLVAEGINADEQTIQTILALSPEQATSYIDGLRKQKRRPYGSGPPVSGAQRQTPQRGQQTAGTRAESQRGPVPRRTDFATREQFVAALNQWQQGQIG